MQVIYTKRFLKSHEDAPENIKADTEALLCLITTQINKTVIDAAPNLKYIGVRATSFAAIDTSYARSKMLNFIPASRFAPRNP